MLKEKEHIDVEKIRMQINELLGPDLWVSDEHCQRFKWKRAAVDEEIVFDWLSGLRRHCDRKRAQLVATTLLPSDHEQFDKFFEFEASPEDFRELLLQMVGLNFVIADRGINFVVTTHPPDFWVLAGPDEICRELSGRDIRFLYQEFRNQEAQSGYARQSYLALIDSIAIV